MCAAARLCKSQFYKTSTRNVKNDETGQWEKRPFYTVDDAFPFGHGEKSVYLIERFMRLKPVEAMAIRWHMGGFDDAAKGGSFAISLAFDRYPLAVKLHMADLESTYLREKGTSDVALRGGEQMIANTNCKFNEKIRRHHCDKWRGP